MSSVVNYLSNVVSAVRGKEQFIKGSSAISEYFSNLEGAIFRGVEPFEDSSTSMDKKDVANNSMAATGFVFSIFFSVLIVILYAYGAAKLSYCYNIQQGSSAGTATMWSFFMFFFPGLYYTYYSFFLNPVCGMTAVVRNKMQLGGRKLY